MNELINFTEQAVKIWRMRNANIFLEHTLTHSNQFPIKCYDANIQMNTQCPNE